MHIAGYYRGLIYNSNMVKDATIQAVLQTSATAAEGCVALVDLARGEHAAALDDLRRALGHDPRQPHARALLDGLRGRGRRHEPPRVSSRAGGADNSVRSISAAVTPLRFPST